MNLLDAAQAEAVGSGAHLTEPDGSPTRPGPVLRCATCGYAIASYRRVPSCPMCHTRAWVVDRHAGSTPGGRRWP